MLAQDDSLDLAATLKSCSIESTTTPTLHARHTSRSLAYDTDCKRMPDAADTWRRSLDFGGRSLEANGQKQQTDDSQAHIGSFSEYLQPRSAHTSQAEV